MRSKLQRAFSEAESAKYLNQLVWNNNQRYSKRKSSGKEGCTDYSYTVTHSKEEEEKAGEEEVYDDGKGTMTNKAVLRPIPYPAVLVELNKNLPPLPEGIPVMIPE